MKQAMIFAAGLGTRLRPLTDHMPKALVQVGGVPLLQLVIERLKKAGFERIIVNVHHFSQQIIDFLHAHDNFGIDILISEERETLLNTGGGIKYAQKLFTNERILIHNVDILSNVDLPHFYTSNQEAAATLLVSERKTKRYLLFDETLKLVGWTNIETGEVRSPFSDINPAHCKMFAFAGIHNFSPTLFSLMQDYPSSFSIIDFYLDICKHIPIKAYIDTKLQLLDVGKPETLSQAAAFMSQWDTSSTSSQSRPAS